MINIYIQIVNKEEIDYNGLLKDFCFGELCEDYLMNFIFKGKENGNYLDIGAHDGIRASNSYAFSKLGWKGICVEAHPDYYKICYNNRNNDKTKILNVACSNEDNDNVTFYSNYRGSLSTLNPNLNLFYKNNYKEYYVDKDYSNKVINKGFYKNEDDNKKVEHFTNGPIQVKSKKLDTIIEENKDFIDVNNIDLVTIDVDGSEEYVFGGFDMLKLKPRVIIFEVSTVRDVVENYMNDKNYFKLYDNNVNSIYCRDEEDLILFKNELNKINGETIVTYDTKHPLDN